MTETRQPLSTLPSKHLNIAVDGQDRFCLSPSKSNKRSHTSAETETTLRTNVVTPTKQSASVVATNGRRSVKRVKTENPEQEQIEATREKAEADNSARLRVWCEQYRRVFPSLRFYFDSCPEEEVRRCTRKINHLRGFVEPFFSKAINVVVTTREIPKLVDAVDTSNVNTSNVDAVDQTKQTYILPLHVGKAPVNQSNVKLQDLRDSQLQNDVLVKAQALGMKIWTLKKLRDSVLRNLIADQETSGRTLSNTLRNEKHLGAFEENIVHFRGPYILVRDMNEVYRPIMCKEWSNVSNAKDGEWPQWRVTRLGKCPFVRDLFAEKNRDHLHVTQVKPERNPLSVNQIQHINASGIQQITSAIQSNWGKSGHSGKENVGSGIANLHKKAVTAKKSTKTNVHIDPTDSKKIRVDNKGGWCENCKENFNDFDQHLRTRTHRSYAKDEANFAELDFLLHSLMRPIKNDIHHT